MKDNFQVYEYPPPEMRKGCELFIAQYEETILDMLTGRNGEHDVEDDICFNKTEVLFRKI